ncbi:MAG: response regulator [Pseudomonadota bacterium]
MSASTQTILIVEDEQKIASVLSDYLAGAGFSTQIVARGDEAVERIRESAPTLIILDLMLPGKDGLTICKEVRQFSDVPIIMLTARVDEIDRLLGLELGADDYVCKPFSPREVVARVKVILRRIANSNATTDTHASSVLRYRDLQMDLERFECRIKQHAIDLTPVEFRLLHALLDKPGRVYSRDQLMDAAYTDRRVVSTRTIDTHIKNLRAKLDAHLSEPIIHSIYSLGYKAE